MKLKDFMKQLQEFVDKNPEALEMETVVTDSGSGYSKTVWSDPEFVMVDDDGGYDTKSSWDREHEYDLWDDEDEKFIPNAVTLN
jgi:hypothetical protein